MDLGDGRGPLQVADIRRRLARLYLRHHDLLRDSSESIDHHLALDRLDGIDDDGHSTRIELLLRLLSLHVCAGEPRAKPRMRMVPADHVLIAAHLLHLVHKLLLEDRVDRLDGHCRTLLRHREDIDDCDRVVVNDFTDHEAHDFEGHTSPAMLHHLQERERRDVNLLSRIVLLEISTRWDSLAAHASHTAHHHLL